MKLSRNHSVAGFTLEDLLMLLLVLAIQAAIFLPILLRPRARICRINCTNNLKQVGLSFRTWELDNNDRFPMQIPLTKGGTMELVERGTVFCHFQVMSNELSTPKILFC